MSSGALARGVLRRHRAGIAVGTLMLGVHQVCEAAVPVLVGVVIDEAIAPGDVKALLLLLGVLALLFATLANAFSVGAYVSERSEQRAELELRLQVVDRVLHPRGGAGANRLTGDLAAVAGIDATRVAAIAWVVPVGTSSVLGAVVGGAFLLDRSLVLGGIVLGGLPLLLLLVERLGRPLARSVGREQAGIAAAGAVAADLVAGLRPLKGIGGEAAGYARYRHASRDARAAAIRAARAKAAYESVLQLCTGGLLVVVALAGGRLAAGGSLSLGDLIAALGLTQFLVGPLSRLGDVGSELARARASARRVAAVLEAPYAIGADGSGAVPPGPGAVVLRAVSYRGLEDVSATVAPGELLGVATPDPDQGEALVRLLARDADPATGAIELDGAALATLDPQALRAELLVAEHEATLFDGSLREVVLGARGHSHALDAALAAAAADEVAASVEGGLDGRVSERGRSLSGGQRQRVALARALCAEPRVLVLHEPTTAVDAATEMRIASALRDARRDVTTIVVTTSPALLAVADRVLLLDGRVLAEGRHDRLVATQERYRAAVLA